MRAATEDLKLTPSGEIALNGGVITQRKIYLDHNASHPLLPSVRQLLVEKIWRQDDCLSNPSSIHRHGQAAKKLVAELRVELGGLFGRADTEEFVLNSGATEGINSVVSGFCRSKLEQGEKVFLLSTVIEHPAVQESFEASGAPYRLLDVDSQGQISSEDFLEAIDQGLAKCEHVLICLQVGNNELGSVYDFENLLPVFYDRFGPKIDPKAKKEKGKMPPLGPQKVCLLLDCAQAVGKVAPDRLRRALHFADYATLSGHKIGAPTGIGALWLRPGLPFTPQFYGGSQEKKRRAGTHNTMGILGLNQALKDWRQNGELYRKKLALQKKYLLGELQKIEGFCYHAPNPPERSLCNTINFHVEGCPEESLLLALDLEGFSLSAASACSSGSMRASATLMAIGLGKKSAESSLRLSLGVESRQEDLESFVRCLGQKVEEIRDSRQRSSRLLPELRL